MSRAIRPASPQAPAIKSTIVDPISQGERIQNKDRLGPDILTAHYFLALPWVEQSHACGRDASFAKPGGAGRHPVQ